MGLGFRERPSLLNTPKISVSTRSQKRPVSVVDERHIQISFKPQQSWAKAEPEAQLTGRFAKAHAPVQTAIKKVRVLAKMARISCVFPSGGIQDNTVNRLLLMSSSESHLPNVPMAFYIEG